jgi:ketosteroid isomerase-like protein
MDDVDDWHRRVLDAYLALGEGDPSQLVEVLDRDIEWRSSGTPFEVGRDAVARRLSTVEGDQVQLVAVRADDQMLVLEFTRPWWSKTSPSSHAVRSIFGIRGEQAVFVSDGLVTRIDSRERMPLEDR